MLIITSQIKDIVLESLLSADNPSFVFDYQDSKTKYDISPDYVELILNEFVRLGLIKAKFFIGNSALIHVQAMAMDLFNHGGFTAEEDLLKNNIEKLRLELDVLSKQLEPKFIEKASHLAQIASAVMQGLTLFR